MTPFVFANSVARALGHSCALLLHRAFEICSFSGLVSAWEENMTLHSARAEEGSLPPVRWETLGQSGSVTGVCYKTKKGRMDITVHQSQATITIYADLGQSEQRVVLAIEYYFTDTPEPPSWKIVECDLQLLLESPYRIEILDKLHRLIYRRHEGVVPFGNSSYGDGDPNHLYNLCTANMLLRQQQLQDELRVLTRELGVHASNSPTTETRSRGEEPVTTS